MNRRHQLAISLSALALLGLGRPAAAGPPYAPNCRVLYYLEDTTDISMALLVLPDGSGPNLTATRIRDGAGTVVNATVLVAIRDSDGQWVQGCPAADIWLEALHGGLAFCANHGAIADESTTYYRTPALNPADPQPPRWEWSTTFSGPFHGGGHTDPASGDEVVVMTASTGATPLPGHLSDLQMNSAVINGDLAVNLDDIPLFVHDYYLGPYDFRSDLLPDNVVNLSDLARFGSSYTKHCQ